MRPRRTTGAARPDSAGGDVAAGSTGLTPGAGDGEFHHSASQGRPRRACRVDQPGSFLLPSTCGLTLSPLADLPSSPRETLRTFWVGWTSPVRGCRLDGILDGTVRLRAGVCEPAASQSPHGRPGERDDQGGGHDRGPAACRPERTGDRRTEGSAKEVADDEGRVEAAVRGSGEGESPSPPTPRIPVRPALTVSLCWRPGPTPRSSRRPATTKS